MVRPSLLLLSVVALALPGAASANGTRLAPSEVPVSDLADATNAVAPSAAGDHVVFSRRIGTGEEYELVDVRISTREVRVLPVGRRPAPFDADVGPSATGGAVVTFSRCERGPVRAGILPSLDFTAARGCRLRILHLDRLGARERALRVAGGSRLSLSTPSVRGRGVAAVAAPVGGRGGTRVLSWRTPRSRPVRLPGGSPPTCPYATCPVAPVAAVDALDLGARSVAFLWRLSDPGYGAGPGIELRSSPLRRGASGRLIAFAGGYVSGACGFRQPLSPSAAGGGGVAFALALSPCTYAETQTLLAVRRADRPGVLAARPQAGLVYGAAYAGDAVYWLQGRAPAGDEPDGGEALPCALARGGCRLVVSRRLAVRQVSSR